MPGEFYPIFDRLWAILAYFVHFGAFWWKTRSFWVHPLGADKWGIVGTLTPRDPTDTPSSAYLCHISCWLSKYSHRYVLPSPVGARMTATTRLQVPTKMTVFSTKMHQSAQNAPT